MQRNVSRRVRYAVVGLGNIAQVAVLPAFAHAKDNSELVALVSSDEAKLRDLSQRYGVKLTGPYEELERLIADGRIDAVYLAVPNALHCEFTVRAARAGAHVLCEKPMAVTDDECATMIRATDAAGVKLMIAYRLHFEKANLDAIERIRGGEIGEPRIFSAIFSQQVNAGDVRTKNSLGGGALRDMGIYCLNASRYLFGAEPLEVYAQQIKGTDARFGDVDDMSTAVLRFPGARLAQMTASQGASKVSELRVVGTKGDIRLEPAFDYSKDLRSFVTVNGKTDVTTIGKRDQFAPQLIYFSKCILEDQTPEPSGVEGRADVRILEAMARSAATGHKVRLTPIEPPARPNGSLEMHVPPVKKVEPVHAPSPSK